MTEYIAAIALAVGFGWLLRLVGVGSLDRLTDGLARLIGGWRPEAWPRGVQEEDRDRPWGRPAARGSRAEPLEPPLPMPTLVRVRPSLRPR